MLTHFYLQVIFFTSINIILLRNYNLSIQISNAITQDNQTSKTYAAKVILTNCKHLLVYEVSEHCISTAFLKQVE